MKLVLRVRKILYNLFVVLLVFNIIFWLAVFSYGTFYYLYIPAVAHVRPVYFQYDTSCFEGTCNFPSANVSLVRKGQDRLLARGQHYLVVLDLEMPESDVNRNLGMFMVKLDIYSRRGQVVASSFRPAVLHYKSPLLRTLYTLIFSPFLLSGTSEEKQMLTVSLFEHYEEDHENPAYGAHIEIHKLSIEIYSAFLKIHAHFTGLRYFMYYWPLLSALVGIGTNFFFLALIALFSWFRVALVKEKSVRVDVANQSLSLETRRFYAMEKLRQEKLLATETTESKSLGEMPSTSKGVQRSDLERIQNISPHNKEHETTEMKPFKREVPSTSKCVQRSDLEKIQNISPHNLESSEELETTETKLPRKVPSTTKGVQRSDLEKTQDISYSTESSDEYESQSPDEFEEIRESDLSMVLRHRHVN